MRTAYAGLFLLSLGGCAFSPMGFDFGWLWGALGVVVGLLVFVISLPTETSDPDTVRLDEHLRRVEERFHANETATEKAFMSLNELRAGVKDHMGRRIVEEKPQVSLCLYCGLTREGEQCKHCGA